MILFTSTCHVSQSLSATYLLLKSALLDIELFFQGRERKREHRYEHVAGLWGAGEIEATKSIRSIYLASCSQLTSNTA